MWVPGLHGIEGIGGRPSRKARRSKRSEQLLEMNRRDIRTVVNLLTGHCLVKYHLKIIDNDHYRSCEQATETTEHLICECPAHFYKRLKNLEGLGDSCSQSAFQTKQTTLPPQSDATTLQPDIETNAIVASVTKANVKKVTSSTKKVNFLKKEVTSTETVASKSTVSISTSMITENPFTHQLKKASNDATISTTISIPTTIMPPKTSPAALPKLTATSTTTLPPTTTGIRTRVDNSNEAISLGHPCVTDLQCRAADPSSKCIEGVCDCIVQGNQTNACSARNRGCIPGTFQCRSTGMCISWFFVCDGRKDCSDGSDEDCKTSKCPNESFRCRDSGKCISKASRCDGIKDCHLVMAVTNQRTSAEAELGGGLEDIVPYVVEMDDVGRAPLLVLDGTVAEMGQMKEIAQFVVVQLYKEEIYHSRLNNEETQFFNHNYLINTNKCTIPNLPTFYPKSNRSKQLPVSCTHFDPLLSYTTVDNEVPRLHIREEAFRKVTDCFPFNSTVELRHDLVWVSCGRSGDTYWPSLRGFPLVPLYENIHQVIALTDAVKQKAKRLIKSTTKKPISVLMVVIDSVSRLNFDRTMPETRGFLKDNNFYEFVGYNKVADNTFPNAMAFLAGLNLTDALNICQPTEYDGLMNCPFIWNKFKEYGYATAYAEDWSRIATFNYFKKGFRNKPTDYYFKPYMDAVAYLRTIEQDTMPFCAGPEIHGERILNLAYDFANNLKNQPKFGLFWMNTFSHNYIDTPKTMDDKVKNFFRNLKQSKILEENIVILLSDHGIRFGEITITTRGYYELRLPMHYISLPDWFKLEYPAETKHLDENTRKLTSNYDLYMTLQHIFKLSGISEEVSQSLACPQCRSFFEKIPDDRSCEEAGIPEIWCTCSQNLTKTAIDLEY
ncbi:unnamed protein product [Ceutorhynchus assimilis]|uniref:Uncharacterized protein n=1 Tax=Ceutorhynchus assimilis TaxID=467358 RepID=A0A9N9QED3_9CUCU|nr:unnamed protein product [Ceutorhynchus assimilis]